MQSLPFLDRDLERDELELELERLDDPLELEELLLEEPLELLELSRCRFRSRSGRALSRSRLEGRSSFFFSGEESELELRRPGIV